MKDLKVIENELIPVYENKEGNQLVNARELYNFLKIDTRFNDWIIRRLKEYDFIENEDFYSFLSKTKGGRPLTEYILQIDTAKELAMVENNSNGRKVRKYFIEVEKKYRNLNKKELKYIAQREAGKMIRNMLTDTIKDKIPESPHKKFVYPNYTRLIYKILFNKTANDLRGERGLTKKQNLRDYFNSDELAQVKELENIVTGLIALGMGYDEIKSILTQRYTKLLAS